MTIRDLIPILDAKVLCGETDLDQEVRSACGSDLMSDVLAFVKDKAILITGLTNVHVMRTAEMLDIHCVIFARGKIPPEDVLEEAREIGIVVLATEYTNYTTCGLLYEAGIRGSSLRSGA
ncbi:MAG: DRTGG domain-containing protein [Eubacteriales bacterium]|nr:DRTGG domain-containing protein [Eubacteriales bacterium]